MTPLSSVCHVPVIFVKYSFLSVLSVTRAGYSDAERQRILGELARVARRFVIIGFYRYTPLHALARHWRSTRGRLAMMTLPHLRELAQASALQLQRVYSLLRLCHAQTFVVLTKSSYVGNRP